SAGRAELPRTAYLNNALRRARSAAEQRSHRFVTLEHLLLALLDDPDASRLMQAAGADAASIRTAIADAVNHRMAGLAGASGSPPSFSHKFDTLFAGASGDAIRTGRKEVDGALALIAMGRDPESNASAILAANGFTSHAAIQIYSATLPAPAPAPQASLASRALAAPSAPSPSPIIVLQSPVAATHDNDMEDMLASVRNILDAEERRERGLPPVSGPPSQPAPVPRNAQPRPEVQLRTDLAPDRQRGPAEFYSQIPAPSNSQERVDPALRFEPPARLPAAQSERRQPPPGYATGFSDPPAQSFDHNLPPPAQPLEKKRKDREHKGASRGRNEAPGPMAKILANVPRKARIGVAETVQIVLSKEDAGQLFARAPRRGQPQLGAEAPPACRAVTVRLSAPEGGFFIEASSPETQWIFDRPSFLSEEPFGTWTWTAIPNESGHSILSVSIFARDIDGNGALSDISAPEQAIKVQVRGNSGSRLWGFFRAILLLLAGGALAVGAVYLLQRTGKLPHWFFAR
ncbi:MAG: Clp protease N-terminal domain-containing protein, partial [Rhodomicrobium sp.]